MAALHPQTDSFSELLRRYGDGLDWDWMLERAAAHKILALLASRVAASGAEAHVPIDTRNRLSAASAAAVERNARALRDLERVGHRFDCAGIPFILVKGPILAQEIYDSPSQRHFFDLDLVVREADVDRAEAILEALGYRLLGGNRYLGFAPPSPSDLARATGAMRRALKRFSHELTFVTDDRSLMPIDLHWHLLPPGRIRVPARQLWEDATTAVVGGVSVRVLDPEATVLHLAMHAWSNRPWSFALLHLVDVAWAMQRLPVAAERLTDLADRWGGRGDLGRSLYALRHALGMEPPAALRALEDEAPPARFRQIATPERLIERYAPPEPGRLARLRQEIDWGLAMGSLRSTAVLLLGKYSALMRYRSGR